MSAIIDDQVDVDEQLDPIFADELRAEPLLCRVCDKPLPASKEISLCGECSRRKTFPVLLKDRSLIAEAQSIREARERREVEAFTEIEQSKPVAAPEKVICARPGCGNLLKPREQGNIYCSNTCYGIVRRANTVQSICVVCENPFEKKVSSRTKACSFKCGKKLSGITQTLMRKEKMPAQKKEKSSNVSVIGRAVEPISAPAPLPIAPAQISQPDETSVELVNITPERAAALLKHNYKHQRPLRSKHVNELATEMRAGRFIAGTQIHFAKLDNTLHLVNGQHTLNAIVQSGCTIKLSIQVTEVETDADVAQLYTYHDIGLKRTLSDAFAAADLPTQLGLTMREVKFLGFGLRILLAGFRAARQSTVTRNDTLDGILDWQSEARAYYTAIQGAATQMKQTMERSAITAVALATFRHAPDKAAQFWRELAMDDGLRNGSPLKTLRDRLYAIRISGGGRTAGREKFSEQDICKTVAQAWNAWTEGRDLQVINIKKDTPIRINLTPYQGEEK